MSDTKDMPGYFKFGEVVVPIDAVTELAIVSSKDKGSRVFVSVNFDLPCESHEKASELYDKLERVRSQFSADTSK